MKISIITASFRSAATIRDTLESVNAQTYPDIDHVIIDADFVEGAIARCVGTPSHQNEQDDGHDTNSVAHGGNPPVRSADDVDEAAGYDDDLLGRPAFEELDGGFVGKGDRLDGLLRGIGGHAHGATQLAIGTHALFQDGVTVAWLFGQSFLLDHARRSVLPERLTDALLERDTGVISARELWDYTHFGDALMTALIERAERWMQMTRLELEVYVDNAAAVALYRKHGFVEEGRLRSYAFRDGAYVDVYSMARLRPAQRPG